MRSSLSTSARHRPLVASYSTFGVVGATRSACRARVLSAASAAPSAGALPARGLVATVLTLRPAESYNLAAVGKLKRGFCAQAHLAAEAHSPQARARLSQTDEHAGRPAGAASPTPARPQAPDCRLGALGAGANFAARPGDTRRPTPAALVGMKRAQRLRKTADFQRVRALRRSWGHPLLV